MMRLFIVEKENRFDMFYIKNIDNASMTHKGALPAQWMEFKVLF
jgi:hypothetical protein